jgi:structural maintenance of chromosome 3 (chondroitin sulfate proteoglycan 6)
MLKEKSGRVTFMPLNRLKPTNPTLPNVTEAFPLIDKLNFDDRYAKAFQQVFGKTCVCKDLVIGAAYVKSHGINTITLDGDKVDRKGALTGGYHDIRRSRLETIKNVTSWRTRHEEESRKSREVKAEVQRLEQEITRSTGQIQVATNQQNKERAAREALLYEEKSLDAEADKLRDRIARLETTIEEGQTELADLEAKIQALKNEKRSPMARGLTDAEETSMATLSEEVDQLQQDFAELGKERADVRCVRSLPRVLTDYILPSSRLVETSSKSS